MGSLRVEGSGRLQVNAVDAMNITCVALLLVASLMSGCAYSTLAVSGQGPLATWAARKTAKLHGNLFCQGHLSGEQRSAQLSRTNTAIRVEAHQDCVR